MGPRQTRESVTRLLDLVLPVGPLLLLPLELLYPLPPLLFALSRGPVDVELARARSGGRGHGVKNALGDCLLDEPELLLERLELLRAPRGSA